MLDQQPVSSYFSFCSSVLQRDEKENRLKGVGVYECILDIRQRLLTLIINVLDFSVLNYHQILYHMKLNKINLRISITNQKQKVASCFAINMIKILLNLLKIYKISNNRMASNKLILVLICMCMLVQLCTPKKKLIFVQELFRHGARYPIYAARNVDGTDYAVDQHSVGQLTTEGKNMHYLLGRKIYDQYWKDLFEGTQFFDRYNNSKFYIKSTDVNRTIESCQSHLMGIFDRLPKLQLTNKTKFSAPLWPDVRAVDGDVFPTAPQFHPLPIHVEKLGTAFNQKGDFLRSYSPENCPNQDIWVKQNQQTSFVKQIYSNPKFVAALDALSNVLKRKVTFEDEGYYYDNYETTLYLSRPTLPIFEDPAYKRDLEYIYTLDLYINLFYNELQIRTTSSGFFEATIANIDRAIKKRDVQWVIYSAHDTTVGNMLAAMNMTNTACIYEAYLKGEDVNNETCIPQYPGFTASIIFQVWDDDETTLQTFKVKYLGKDRRIPFCDYKYECPVSVLKQWYESKIKVASFAANCGLYNEDKQFYKAFAVLELGVIISFLIYIVLKSLKRPTGVSSAVVKKNEQPTDSLKEPIMKEQIQA